MSATTEPVRILLVQAWTEPLAPLRAALRDAGMIARIVRVDIEPALNAALERGSKFDVLVYDPATRAIGRELIAARLRDHRRCLPLVAYRGVATLATDIRDALARLRN